MARGGNRKKFRYPFHQTHQRRFDEEKNIHRMSSGLVHQIT
jgi:hypothetical protein